MNILDFDFYARLKQDYLTHKKLFVAFDYDNTVYDYHNKGLNFDSIVELLHVCRELGFILILFTANEDEAIERVKLDLKRRNITYDFINENPIKQTRKPYYNILLDDRAGLIESYNYLKKLTDEIRNKKI